MGSDTQQVAVPPELDGVRFDKALAAMAHISRTQARRLIDSGEAGWASGVEADARLPVVSGDLAWYRIVTATGPHPQQIDFDVLYEDEHLVVINKPAGLVTHPGPGNADGTLVSGLLARWPEILGVGEHPRWGIVHRLDRETSGVLVVARRAAAHQALSAALRLREVTREYLTLVHGQFSAATGTIDAPIDRVRAKRVVAIGGRPSVTHYRRIAAWTRDDFTLLDVTLETGRTHQIRVHLESIQRFVVGDRVYGRPGSTGVDPGRVWLHARRLRFAHPTTGQPIDVRAPIPADLRASVDALGVPDLGTMPAVFAQE